MNIWGRELNLARDGTVNSVMLGLRREQFVACTRSVARGHVRKEEDKAEVVGDNEAFWVSDKPTLASLDELKLLAG
jgi:hypothetical protein